MHEMMIVVMIVVGGGWCCLVKTDADSSFFFLLLLLFIRASCELSVLLVITYCIGLDELVAIAWCM